MTTVTITKPLSETKERILAELSAGPLSGAEIERRIGIPASTIGKALRSLASLGYVRRQGVGAFVNWERLVYDAVAKAEPTPDAPIHAPPSERIRLLQELIELETTIEEREAVTQEMRARRDRIVREVLGEPAF